MIKGIIFDMDGVIVDSEYTFLESKAELLKDVGFPLGISYHYQFMGTTSEFMWKKIKEDLSLPGSVEDYIKEMTARRKEIIKRDGLKPIEGVVEFIHRLAEENVRLAVASSSPKKDIIHNLKELGIRDCFDALVSGEEVNRSKPAPDVFLEAAKQIEIAPAESLAFEDSHNGSIAVKKAGMFCVGVENDNYPPQDLSQADQLISSFSEVELKDLNRSFINNKK
ncbi:HAD family hydrolase [Enterococcus sp. LJL128]|uniref:HAD family hydrolase n=1 Tax=Enterococcus sp. LJL51 TaxID=3416656 RepID=UPI003CF9F04E